MHTWTHISVIRTWNDENHLWKKNKLSCTLPISHQLTHTYQTYIAAVHQGASVVFWLHFWGTFISSIFIYTLWPGQVVFITNAKNRYVTDNGRQLICVSLVPIFAVWSWPDSDTNWMQSLIFPIFLGTLKRPRAMHTKGTIQSFIVCWELDDWYWYHSHIYSNYQVWNHRACSQYAYLSVRADCCMFVHLCNWDLIILVTLRVDSQMRLYNRNILHKWNVMFS